MAKTRKRTDTYVEQPHAAEDAYFLRLRVRAKMEASRRKSHLARLRAAIKARDRANNAIRAAAQKAFKPGGRVTWKHGKHTRTGVVEEVYGFGRFCTVRVCTPTGKRVRLEVESLDLTT